MHMRLYGFWRSLATYRVRVALALKGLDATEVSIDLLQGEQHTDAYRVVNPQSVVPALVIDDGPPLFQSMAILEYLDETHPQPPLLPQDARGRARVRGLAQIVVSDGHPLIVPRIRGYLEKELKVDEPARNRWLAHWSLQGARSGRRPSGERARNRALLPWRHADDRRHLPRVAGDRRKNYFNCDVSGVPTVMRVFDECMKIDAFDRALPQNQPGAPKITALSVLRYKPRLTN